MNSTSYTSHVFSSKKGVFSRCQKIPVAHYFSMFASLLIHWGDILDQAQGSPAAESFSLAFNSTVSSSSAPSNIPHSHFYLIPTDKLVTPPVYFTYTQLIPIHLAWRPPTNLFLQPPSDFFSSVLFRVNPSTYVQTGSFWWPVIFHHLSLLSFHNCLHLFSVPSFTISLKSKSEKTSFLNMDASRCVTRELKFWIRWTGHIILVGDNLSHTN